MRLAVELKTIHQDRKRGQVAAIYEEDDSAATADYKADNNFGYDKIAAINAIRQRQGKPPICRNFRRSFGKTNSSNGKSDVTCRYCKKKGHLQPECQKRIAENGAMTNAEGKPFVKKVNTAAVAVDPGRVILLAYVYVRGHRPGNNPLCAGQDRGLRGRWQPVWWT